MVQKTLRSVAQEADGMTKDGRSQEYLELLRGAITADDYLEKMKNEINEQLGVGSGVPTRPAVSK